MYLIVIKLLTQRCVGILSLCAVCVHPCKKQSRQRAAGVGGHVYIQPLIG